MKWTKSYRRYLMLTLLSILTLGLVAGGECQIGGGDEVEVFRTITAE